MAVVELERGLFDLAVVSLVAALSPIVAGLLSRLRVPQVVILILGGILYSLWKTSGADVRTSAG